MLSIELNGYESPGVLRAVLSALRAYADEVPDEMADERITSIAMGNMPPPAEPVAAEAPAAAAAGPEVTPADKPRRKKAPAAEEVKPAVQEPQPNEVTGAQIRAVARKFSTDELREVALAILRRHGCTSVTELEALKNSVRVAALHEFEAAATEHNLG